MTESEASPLPYSSEARLVESLRELLPSYLSARAPAWSYKFEFPVGRTIADIVCVLWSHESFVPPQPLTISECVIMSWIRRHGATQINLLKHTYGLASGELRQGSLDRLTEWGLLSRGNGGSVAALVDWPSSITILAIEAKLTDWRHAARQAQSYLTYADESYVALPESNVSSRASSSGLLEEASIGLFTVSAGLKVLRHAPKARSQQFDWRREFAASRVFHHNVKRHN